MGAGHSEEARARAEWFSAAATGDCKVLCRLADSARCGTGGTPATSWAVAPGAPGTASGAVQVPLVDAKDSRGVTALMSAAGSGHEECVSLLLRRGADPNAPDHRGWTATMHAAFAGHERCLRRLAASGADLNARDFLGTTAAMRAALGGHTECLEALTDFGADASLTDSLGLSAAAHARRNGHLRCAEILAKRAKEAASSKKVRLLSNRAATKGDLAAGVSGVEVADKFEYEHLPTILLRSGAPRKSRTFVWAAHLPSEGQMQKVGGAAEPLSAC
mmetsp:Transcript_97800/g.273780  ORF Transcript_97800/g.273780 Transcript_97800/m.273780 type:complete len:276 (-) Transcript_97800:228-1055(-)